MAAVYSEHRATFQDKPLGYLLCVLFVPLGVGILALLWWHFIVRFETLKVVDGKVIYEQGIFSKDHVELQMRTVRSVRIAQRFEQRIFGTGTVFITSSGSSPEIVAHGMPRARELRSLLAGHDAPM